MPTTKELYSDPATGKYSAEREVLHQQIVGKILSGKAPSDDEAPHFLLIGGGVGTGKPILNRLLQNEGIIDKAHTAIIEPKHFIDVLPELQTLKDVQHPEKRPEFIDEYFDISRKAVQAAVERDLSIVYVDHAERPEVIEAMVRDVKSANYETAAIMMTCSAEHFVKRTAQREADQGRQGISELERFAAQHLELAATFEQTPKMFDSAAIMYTGKNEIPETAARYHRDERGQLNVEVVNEGYLEAYRYEATRRGLKDTGLVKGIFPEEQAVQPHDRSAEMARSGGEKGQGRREVVTSPPGPYSTILLPAIDDGLAERFLAQKAKDRQAQKAAAEKVEIIPPDRGTGNQQAGIAVSGNSRNTRGGR